MTNRDTIRARIRKLRQMTEANGCTEAEAMAAAERAAQLMAAAGLTEMSLDSETCGSRSRSGRSSVRLKLWSIIAYCTNTALTTIYEFRGSGCEPTFTGQGGQPEIADFLRVVCDRAIDREARHFKASPFYRRRRSVRTRRQAINDFTDAMCSRLIAKLLDLFEAQVDDERRKTAVTLRDTEFEGSQDTDYRERRITYWEAIAAGSQAGERVQISHGLSEDRPLDQIEGFST